MFFSYDKTRITTIVLEAAQDHALQENKLNGEDPKTRYTS